MHGGTGTIKEDVAALRALPPTLNPAPFVLIANRPTIIPGLIALVAKTAPQLPTLLLDTDPTPGPLVHELALRTQLPALLPDLVATLNQALPAHQHLVVPPHLADTTVTPDTLDSTPVESVRASPWGRNHTPDTPPTMPVAPAVMGPTPTTLVVVDPTPDLVTHQDDDLPSWMTDRVDTPATTTPAPHTVTEPTPATPPAPTVPTPVVAPQPQPTMPVAPAVDVTPQPTPAVIPQAPQAHPTAPTHRANLIIVTSAKGGAGKTTTARLLAQCAATQGLRTVLIDGNGGQSGQRKMMRVTDTTPTIYDYAVGATTERDTIITPEQTATTRPHHLDPVRYATVFAPPGSVADHNIVTPDVYTRIVNYARTIADLVIVDTQMIEAPDMRNPHSFAVAFTTHHVRDNNGWLLALFDNNKEAYENLLGTHTEPGILADIHNQGVPPNRILLLATNIKENVEFDDAQFATNTTGWGTFVGHTTANTTMEGALNAGNLPYDNPTVSTALHTVLHHVTNHPIFQHPTPARRGLFARKRSGR